MTLIGNNSPTLVNFLHSSHVYVNIDKLEMTGKYVLSKTPTPLSHPGEHLYENNTTDKLFFYINSHVLPVLTSTIQSVTPSGID